MSYSFNDSQNQIKRNNKLNDKKESDYLDSKIKTVCEIFNSNQNPGILKIYNDLYDKDCIKLDNIETIIFIIFILIIENDNCNRGDINIENYKDIAKLFDKYKDKFKMIHGNYDDKSLAILFLTYLQKMYDVGIYKIIQK